MLRLIRMSQGSRIGISVPLENLIGRARWLNSEARGNDDGVISVPTDALSYEHEYGLPVLASGKAPDGHLRRCARSGCLPARNRAPCQLSNCVALFRAARRSYR